ncbi:MAG: T9SS C-terminal target domain-containing protein [Bacteroidetes bacterium]|nr:MAG: T9SS C-terminal target domain-containing protein [Bacteroidota bacterium]
MPDANTIAIGAPYNAGTGTNAGHVRVYTWNGSNWIQKGTDIDGEAIEDRSGWAVSMPDANTVAIGAPYNDGSGVDAGHVRVYTWNGSNWVQKGGDIDGEAAGNLSGYSVSMPNANTIAIGAPNNNDAGSYTGHVRVYTWNGSNWVQKGTDIDGEYVNGGSRSGWSVSMPDTNTVAIGGPYNSEIDINSGHVRIYQWNGNAWIQKGMDINSQTAYDYCGYAVSMPDSATVGIGIYMGDGSAGGNSGLVRVFTCLGYAVSVNTTHASCFNNNDGNATVSVTEGAAPYTYIWNNSATTQSITGLTAGTYIVTVTDANGCTASDTGIVNEPSALTVTTTVTNIPCNGYNNGSIITNASGGTSPYYYTWNNLATTSNLTGLTTGIYSLTVSDYNGCTNSTSTTINEPPAISVSLSVTSSTCNNANGSISVFTSGGISPYSYNWSTGATTSTITGLMAGTYSVTVTDYNGCTTSASGTVSEPAAISLFITATDASCAGNNDGSVITNVTGGTTPYSYSWSNGATTQNITGLIAGTYSVTVTDYNGCTASASDVVSDPAFLSALTTATGVSCAGNKDGSVITNVTGGTTPYSYNWSNGATTQNITGLNGGTYSVTVTDNNGCLTSATSVVSVPSAISVSLSPSNPTCGNSDGSIYAGVIGGLQPYSFSWNTIPAQFTQTATGLFAGYYSFTVTDANGCTKIATQILSDNGAPSVSISYANENCGLADAYILTTVTGGISPYSYMWSTGSTATKLDNISAGVYTLTVSDDNLCKAIEVVSISAIGTTPASISGTAVSSSSGLAIDQGIVVLYNGSMPAPYPALDTVPLSTGGMYNTGNLPAIGDYYVKVIPDTTIYPNTVPTYYGNEVLWSNAQVISAQCDINSVADVTVLDLTPLTGSTTIEGTIVSITNAYKSKYSAGKMAGDPIPGVDVILEQVPGGIVASDKTNNNGSYQFLNVPNGNYKINVDIPGLPQVEIHNVTIMNQDTAVTNMDYIVTNSIFIDSTGSITPVKDIAETPFRLDIYPNPFKTHFQLNFELQETSDVDITVLDLAGRVIYSKKTTSMQAGNHSVEITDKQLHKTEGVYILKFSSGKQQIITKLINLK